LSLISHRRFVAWATSYTRDTYLQAPYHWVAYRCGKKKAIVAMVQNLLVLVSHLLKGRLPTGHCWPISLRDVPWRGPSTVLAKT
jgi:hypothetical protein